MADKITREEKTIATLDLVLRVVVDAGNWDVFSKRLVRYTREQYGIELPDDIGDLPDTSEVSKVLLSHLGEDKAVLSAYRIAELTQPSEMDRAKVTEGGLAVLNASRDESEAQNPSNPEPESIESDAVEDLGVAAESDPSDDEPDPEPEHDQREADHDSDADSGYYSADGGRPGTPVDEEPQDDSPSSEETASTVIEEAQTSASNDSHDDDTHRDDGSASEEDLERDALVAPADPFPNLRKCFERQAMMLTGALKDASDTADRPETLSVDSVQRQLERFVFNPDRRVPAEHLEVRYNFYSPFLTPKAIASYHIFAVTASIPLSCKANRSGSDLLAKAKESTFFKRLPKWRLGIEIDDGLGTEVTAITELEEAKMVPLKDDVSRLQWAKMRGEHIRFFSYPSLHMPPKISRMLMETLLQPFADENQKAEEALPCLSDEEVLAIVDPTGRLHGEDALKAVEKRRAAVTMAVRYTATLELMERVFREPSMVKKMQEVLHHTFHHGFVALVRETAKVNLSNYATFHGITYNNPLNNCIMSKLLEGADKEDYVVDSIYLFLVLTWQTAMGMWQQAIDDMTIQMYTEVFTKNKYRLYSLPNPTAIGKAIVDILMDYDRLTEEMRKALPNFTCQSQITAFRHFLLERSNIPAVAAPFMPSDFVPLAYKQSPPLLWDQVYLLQLAFYLTKHGGYLWEAPEEEANNPSNRTYCPCNLCSPHRMPGHNAALHNEILAIGTFEIRSPDGKTFKLTPELWTNAYLDKFDAEDFHPFTVFHYPENASRFASTLKACVTQSPEILSLIRQIQESREEFLLTKGKGVYKDPNTGETISRQPRDSARAQHAGDGQALPAPGAYTAGGNRAETAPAGAVRLAPDCQDGQFPIAKVGPHYHGSKNARREDQGYRGGPGGVRGEREVVLSRRAGGRRFGRRNTRQSGYNERANRYFGRGGGGGSVRGQQGEHPTTSPSASEPPAPSRILARGTPPSPERRDRQEE